MLAAVVSWDSGGHFLPQTLDTENNAALLNHKDNDDIQCRKQHQNFHSTLVYDTEVKKIMYIITVKLERYSL
jgi:hypothetical protein